MNLFLSSTPSDLIPERQVTENVIVAFGLQASLFYETWQEQ